MRYEKRSALEVGSLEVRFRKLERGIRGVLRKLIRETRNEHVSLEVYLVGRGTMNKNVLSFPAPKHFPHPNRTGLYLGEIYLNPDYMRSHGENLNRMLVHGFLHLLGYDHVKKGDRIAMERREQVLMEQLHLPSAKVRFPDNE